MVVAVPVSADIERGYGDTLEEVEATVAGVIAAGAVGINLEDSIAQGRLRSPVEQAARLQCARTAAKRAGVAELFINARTDVYLLGGTRVGREDAVVRRARIYAAAGADCLFVPGLLELDPLEWLAGRSPLPINVMAGPGGPSVADLAAVGVRRITLGTSFSELAFSTVHDRLVEVLGDGVLGWASPSLTYARLNSLMPEG